MARRVNSKFLVFLVALSGAVLLMGIGGIYLHKTLHRADYKQLEADADAVIKEADQKSGTEREDKLEKAADLLVRARDQVPDNTQILVKLGNTLDRLTAKDQMHVGHARMQWNKAVSVDPNCLPALRALLKSYADELDLNPRPEVFVELKKVCDRLLNATSADISAQEKMLVQEKKQIAIINEWLANQSASNDEVQQSIDTYLPELMKNDPDNADLPRTLAKARIQQARERLNRGEMQDASLVLNDATKMLDAACKGRDQNASMQYRAFQAYSWIKQIYPGIKNDQVKEKEYNDRIAKCIDSALAVAKNMDPAKDPLCVDIYQAASERANQQNQKRNAEKIMRGFCGFFPAVLRPDFEDKAEKIMRGFYGAHKDDQHARLTMARVLELKGDAASREEAVGILKQKVIEQEGLTGFQALLQKELAAQTKVELIRVYLADYANAPQGDKAALKQTIDDEMEKLRHLYLPQSVPVLNLEGRFHLLKRENVEAVRTFEQAVQRMSPGNMDADLVFQLASAYILTGQPGRARQKLEQVVLKVDTAVDPRVLLAKLLLESNELQAAAVQVRKLQELAPDSPEVKQLAAELALANHKENEPAAKAVYAGLPETTRDERLNKAFAAISLSRGDEGARLLETLLKDAPDNVRQMAELPPDASDDQKKETEKKVTQDIRASLALAQVYATTLGQKETAKRVLADSLKLHPNDPTLVEYDARLHDMLPDVIYAQVSKAVQKTSDPFTREMRMFDLETRPGGHPEQAFGHLVKAEEIKPDNGRVLDLMVTHYMDLGKLDQAAADQAARQDDKAAAQEASERANAAFNQAAALVERLAKLNVDECKGMMYRYRLSMARGDWAAAEDQGRQLTQSYSEFAMSWLVTAQVLQLRGKFNDAVHFYLEVLNRQPGHYDAYRGLIECYLQLNQPEDAEIRLREARTKYFPNDPLLREQLLSFLVNNGKAAEAIPERKSILDDNKQRQKDVPNDYLQLANAYFHAAQDEAASKPADSADHLNKAFQILAAGKQRFPDERRFAGQLAEMYLYNRDLPAGEKILMELYHRADLKDDPEPAMLLSNFHVLANKLEEAETYLNEAMVKAEKKEGGPDILVRLRLASLQAQQRKFDAAHNTLKNAGNAAQSDPSIIRQRLEIMIAQGRRDEARKALQAELATRDDPGLHNLLADLLINDKEIDAASNELDHVLAIDPRNGVAIYLQSLALDIKGDTDRAIAQLRELRNRDPRNAPVRMLLAELYSKTGKTDAAIGELQEALQKIPTNREIRLALIQSYRRQQPLTNDSMKSVVTLCRFAEADPVLRSDPTWAREEALAYADMNPPNVPQAVIEWKQAIALAPDNPNYHREFIDLLIRFNDWNAVVNETDKLIEAGHNEWWLHHQRGVAMAGLGDKDKSLKEFDLALAVTDLKTDPDQMEHIIRRGLGENISHEEAIKHLTPLLANDTDGRWRLLEAFELRTVGKFQQAQDIVDILLADPANKPADRRVPLLHAKADISQAFADASSKDPAQTLAQYRRVRDAYIELLGFFPDDIVVLNNLAFVLSERIPAPEGGPLKAKTYSSKAYDLVRFKPIPSVLVLDTQGWVLTLCGGDDAIEGLNILHKMIAEREDTRTFVEGRYHLAEAYLRASKPDSASAQKWLKEALELIAVDEKAGRPVDPVLKDKILTSLAKATSAVTSGR